MKKNILYILLFSSFSLFAGNGDRSGTAGSPQLLFNPWSRSSGWAGANSAGIQGIESSFSNIAGLSTVPKTEIVFSRCNLFQGTGVNINSFGFAQKLSNSDGSGGVLGLLINNLSSGDILRTTYEQPDGNGSTYAVQYLDIGLGYSKKFSNSISGGMMAKIISQGTADVKSSGMALDAGVQYGTSLRSVKVVDSATALKQRIIKLKGNDLKFGISIRNVGPDLSFKGDGLSIRAVDNNKTYPSTVEQRSAGFNLPTVLNIGASYDFRLDGNDEKYDYKLTLAANYYSNSFSQDQQAIGMEFGYKKFLMLRGGMIYEKNISDATKRISAFTGPSFGFSFNLPFSKTNNSSIAADYSYRFTAILGNVQTFGIRINLDSNND